MSDILTNMFVYLRAYFILANHTFLDFPNIHYIEEKDNDWKKR